MRGDPAPHSSRARCSCASGERGVHPRNTRARARARADRTPKEGKDLLASFHHSPEPTHNSGAPRSHAIPTSQSARASMLRLPPAAAYPSTPPGFTSLGGAANGCSAMTTAAGMQERGLRRFSGRAARTHAGRRAGRTGFGCLIGSASGPPLGRGGGRREGGVFKGKKNEV